MKALIDQVEPKQLSIAKSKYAEWSKFEWYNLGGSTASSHVERVTKTFKFQMLDYIRNTCAPGFNSFSSDIKKILLGLYIEGLPLSKFNEIPDYWCDEKDGVINHFIKHLVSKRDPAVMVDRMTDVLLSHYNQTLCLLFDEIKKSLTQYKRLL